MSATITFGWWLVPAAITAAAYVWASMKEDRRPVHDYGRIGQSAANAIIHGVALVVSLIAWLVWAVLA